MNFLENMLNLPPYGLDAPAKNGLYREALSQLTAYHYRECAEYRRILDLLGYSATNSAAVTDIPFLPVRLFKEIDLISVPEEAVIKTMTSSGTGGQKTSKIFLDRENAVRQSKVLAAIVGSVLGKQRLPMLIIDTASILRDRNSFSARGAGILGFSFFGRDVTYALDEDMQLDEQAVKEFAEKYHGQPVFLFGFTFMVWKCFLEQLQARNLHLDLSGGVLIHGGGWKKLAAEAVDNDSFKQQVHRHTGISRVVNYYGMVEQTGSIFMECKSGHLHTSVFSDIIVRDFRDFSDLGAHNEGLLQLVSLLPTSYPGHSILTEDTGIILGCDDCPCGALGKYFRVTGRVEKAEIRGCSNVFAAGE